MHYSNLVKYWNIENHLIRYIILQSEYGTALAFHKSIDIYIYIIAWTGGLKSQNHTWIQLLKVMWQGEDSKTYCVYFKKAGTLKPNFNAFCYERISIFQQQKYPHNVRIWLVQWWWDQENMMLKRSVQVSTTVKKNIYFTKHSTPIHLRTKIASKKLLLSSPTWLLICDYSNLPHLYSDISGGHFPHHHHHEKSTKNPRKPAVSDDALLYLLLDVWLPTSWWHHLAGQRVRDVGEGGRRAALLWIECLSWQWSSRGWGV